uniref:TH1 domain-containing protein n=1 Tax=Physcomitrium patens TaxID=3218 RepID=A0A7I4FVA9_PHYPA
MLGEDGMEPFMGMKVRRHSSMYRVYSADYIDVPANPTIVKLLSKQGDKQVLFADNIMKVNRKCKLVRRVLIVTDVAIYMLDSVFFRLKHRIPMQASEWLVQNIDKVSLSELSDNFLAVSVPSEYDFLIASTRKSEIVTVLVEAVKQLTTTLPENELQSGCQLAQKFTKLVGVLNGVCSFEYRIDAEHTREVHFESVEDGGTKTKFVDK